MMFTLPWQDRKINMREEQQPLALKPVVRFFNANRNDCIVEQKSKNLKLRS